MSYLLSLVNADPSLNDPSLKDLNLLQHFDGPIPETTDFLCYHINDTQAIQVIRVMDQSHCLFERVVFPMERILFVAISEAYLEIYESVLDGTISERIDCESLRVI